MFNRAQACKDRGLVRTYFESAKSIWSKLYRSIFGWPRIGIELGILGRVCGFTVVFREPLFGRERFKQPDVSKNRVTSPEALIFALIYPYKCFLLPSSHYTIRPLRNASTLYPLPLISRWKFMSHFNIGQDRQEKQEREEKKINIGSPSLSLYS